MNAWCLETSLCPKALLDLGKDKLQFQTTEGQIRSCFVGKLSGIREHIQMMSYFLGSQVIPINCVNFFQAKSY